jgi:hypothetical protein
VLQARCLVLVGDGNFMTCTKNVSVAILSVFGFPMFKGMMKLTGCELRVAASDGFQSILCSIHCNSVYNI